MTGDMREKQARRTLHREGRTIRRPVREDGSETFDLAYVRTGPMTPTPTVVIPGGPGLASVVPFQGFRRLAHQRGLDLLMVEHRGVGLSRRLDDGTTLPQDAVTVEAVADDIAAVLDDVGARQAVVVGSSYGTYLAQAVAVRHPERVAGLILDSTMLSVEDDLAANRAHRRRLLWDGDDPATSHLAALVRRLAEAGEPMAALTHVVQVVYEFGGPDTLERLLTSRLRGGSTRLWDRIAALGHQELDGTGVPFLMEPDLVSGIAYGQLGYGQPLDGRPLDPQLTFTTAAPNAPAYTGAPYDFAEHAADYAWPTVAISGDRDLRTPRSVAHRLVDLAPQGVLVPIHDTGHSVLDTHQLALLHVIHGVQQGRAEALPAFADRISDLPRRGASGLLGPILTAAVRATARP